MHTSIYQYFRLNIFIFTIHLIFSNMQVTTTIFLHASLIHITVVTKTVTSSHSNQINLYFFHAIDSNHHTCAYIIRGLTYTHSLHIAFVIFLVYAYHHLMTPNHANSQNQLRTSIVLMCRLAAVHAPPSSAYRIWVLA